MKQLDLTKVDVQLHENPARSDFTHSQLRNSEIKKKLKCLNCNELIFRPLNDDNKETFCCSGCAIVYKNLKDPNRKIKNFEYLDDAEFWKQYFNQDIPNSIVLYTEGIHCTDCIIKIQNLKNKIPDIKNIQVKLGESTTTIFSDQHTSFNEVAQEIEKLGYTVHPVFQSSEIELKQQQENKKMLNRLGVAAACSGNIMILSVALYSGVDGALAQAFGWLNFFLVIPVITFSAQPFFKSSFYKLKNKEVSIDLPIALAISLGFLYGFYQLTQGEFETYFDSIALLVFLLLSSRYLLSRMRQKVFSGSHLLSFHQPIKTLLLDQKRQSFIPVYTKELKKNDIISCNTNETIAADGVLIKGKSLIDSSVITGESWPSEVQEGSTLYAGCKNLKSPILIRVTNTLEKTRIAKILNTAESQLKTKAQLLTLTDEIAQWFVSIVLISSAILFTVIFFQHPFQEALSRALALIIITCPCALALATPLAMTKALKKASAIGILIESSETIERLSRVKKIFFDKTGTLTLGQFKVIDVSYDSDHLDFHQFASIVYSIENSFDHPIAFAIKNYFGQHQPELLKTTNCEFIPTKGVSAYINQLKYEMQTLSLNRSLSSPLTVVEITENQKKIGTITLGDQIKSEALTLIQKLKSQYEIYILSGDQKHNCNAVAKTLGIKPSNVYANVSPEEKCVILKNHQDSVMIGDGANDALALASASVGISLRGGVESSLKASQVYLSSGSIQDILILFQLTKSTFRTIKRNLAFSFSYNSFGAIFATLGLVNPLFAAILMPISAITIFTSTYYERAK